MKAKVAHGDVEKLWESIGMNRSTVSRYIKMYNDFQMLPSGQQMDFPESIAQHRVLLGDTAQERQEYFQRVVEDTGSSQPTPAQIVDNSNSQTAIEAAADFKAAKQAHKQAMEQLGFIDSDLVGSSSITEGVSVWDSLLDYTEEWKEYKKLFFKVAHPDMEGGSVGASQFLSVLDNVYTVARRDEKVASRLEQLKLLTNEIKKQIKKDNK